MRILWISDAGTKTGFSRVTHALGERLAGMGHEIHVLAIGYDGRYPYHGPLSLYRADVPMDVEIGGRQRRAQHGAGFHRVTELLDALDPDVVVTLMDAPLLVALLTENPFDLQKRLATRTVISYMPIDGYELPKTWASLVPLVRFVAMSRFGKEQLEMLGATDVPVVLHGVETADFYRVGEDHPVILSNGQALTSKAQCRAAFNIPETAFVIGRVDTNSGRKDWPATWKVIERFHHLPDRPAEILSVFHTKLNNPGHGVDLAALISKGVGKFMVTNGGDWPQGNLLALMNCWDVCLTTTRGEGFGLGSAEAMACGIPVLAPNHSAVAEVVGDAGILVPPLEDAFWANPYGVTQKLSDTEAMARALGALVPELARGVFGEIGMRRAAELDWDRSAQQFNAILATSRLEASDAVRVEQRTA